MPQVLKENIRISGYFIGNISIIFMIFASIIIIFTIAYFPLVLYKNLCISKDYKVTPHLTSSNRTVK